MSKPWWERPPARNFLFAFWEGLATPLEGWRFMRLHPKLWRYGWIPLGLNIIISVFMLALLYVGAQQLLAWFLPLIPAGWFWFLLKAVAVLGVILVSMGIVVGLWFLLSAILCGYFYSQLARKVEHTLGTPPSDLHEVPLLYEIAYALRTATLLVFGNLALLLLNLIPVIGSALSVGLTFYFDCFLFGFEYFDYAMALRGKRYKEKRRFLRENRFHNLGLGASVFSFTFIPLLGPVVLTTAVVGSVILHRRILQSNQ